MIGIVNSIIIESMIQSPSFGREGVFILNLWPDQFNQQNGTVNEGCPSITPYLLEGPGPHPVVVVCPGGGYVGRANHEGEPIAKWLNGIGLSAVVLHYRVAPYRHPVPLHDAQRAIRLARHQASQWNLDPTRVGILGFSAGGHLASTAGTHYDSGDLTNADVVEHQSCRPDFMILCYPVITMGEYAHAGSRTALMGDSPSADMLKLLSNETQVTPATPPTFLWHTADDDVVPVENSLMFANALSKNKVPFSLYVFEHGAHGLGLAEADSDVRAWTTLCASWLKVRGYIR